MTDIVKHSAGKPLRLGVERDGKLIQPHGHAGRAGRASRSTGRRSANRGYLGVEIGRPPRRSRLLAAVGARFSTMWQVTDQDGRRARRRRSRRAACRPSFHQVTNAKAATVGGRTTPAPRPGRCPSSASPTSGAQSEQAGLAAVLMLLIAINIVFGILNMLPMIPLDGGHVAIATYEWIRTKKGQPYYRADITKLFPVAAVFMAFLPCSSSPASTSTSPTRSRSRTDRPWSSPPPSCRPAGRPAASRSAACRSATARRSRCSR